MTETWYAVVDKNGRVLDVSASEWRANDSKWILENEAGHTKGTLSIHQVEDPNLLVLWEN